MTKQCPFCNIEMDDLVNIFELDAGYWMEISSKMKEVRQYRHYECPNASSSSKSINAPLRDRL